MFAGMRARRAHVRRGPRTIRLHNDSGETLRLCIEPFPYHYDIPVGEIAELRGLDPDEDVLEFMVHKDACVSVWSSNEVAVVLVGERRLSPVPHI